GGGALLARRRVDAERTRGESPRAFQRSAGDRPEPFRGPPEGRGGAPGTAALRRGDRVSPARRAREGGRPASALLAGVRLRGVGSAGERQGGPESHHRAEP